MKKYAIIILGIALCFIVSGCGEVDSSSIKTDSVYNTELGIVISIGMTKDAVDDLVGVAGEKSYYYDYPDGLSIKYEDGKADEIRLEGILCPWVVRGDIGPRSKVEDVQNTYGVQDVDSIEMYGKSYNILQYYVDANGAEVGIVDKFAIISFHIDDDAVYVDSINIGK